jgi:hypothetical protein
MFVFSLPLAYSTQADGEKVIRLRVPFARTPQLPTFFVWTPTCQIPRLASAEPSIPGHPGTDLPFYHSITFSATYADRGFGTPCARDSQQKRKAGVAQIPQGEGKTMRKATITVLTLALTATVGFARDEQQPWENLKELQAGQKIEVVDMGLKSFSGAFASVSDEAILLQHKGGDVTIERVNIMRISMRDPSKRTRNMLLGTAIGAGAGLALGLVLNAPGSNEGNDNPALIAGLTAGSAGAGLGIAVDSGYRTIYRAAKHTTSSTH